MTRRCSNNSNILVNELVLARSEGTLWAARVISSGGRRLRVQFFDKENTTGMYHEASVVALHVDDQIQTSNPLAQEALQKAKIELCGRQWGCQWRVARAREKQGLTRSARAAASMDLNENEEDESDEESDEEDVEVDVEKLDDEDEGGDGNPILPEPVAAAVPANAMILAPNEIVAHVEEARIETIVGDVMEPLIQAPIALQTNVEEVVVPALNKAVRVEAPLVLRDQVREVGSEVAELRNQAPKRGASSIQDDNDQATKREKQDPEPVVEAAKAAKAAEAAGTSGGWLKQTLAAVTRLWTPKN